jgi:hypothetical protein
MPLPCRYRCIACRISSLATDLYRDFAGKGKANLQPADRNTDLLVPTATPARYERTSPGSRQRGTPNGRPPAGLGAERPRSCALRGAHDEIRTRLCTASKAASTTPFPPPVWNLAIVCVLVPSSGQEDHLMKTDNLQMSRASRVWLTEDACDLDGFRALV